MKCKGLLSRHVVLPGYEPHRFKEPVYALVLHQRGVIEEVLLQEPTTEVVDVIGQHNSCEIEVFEHFYVMPGLVDCNVRLNGEWEGSSFTTKAAISGQIYAGGVTVVATEGTIYNLETDIGELYCDLGMIGIVQSQEDVQMQCNKGVLAVKAYHSPPSNIVQAAVISEVLRAVARTSLPLILDINKPDGHLMYLVSPFRTLPVTDRYTTQSQKSRSHTFAGAIATTVEDQDKDLSDEEESPGLPVNSQDASIKKHSETYTELLASERMTYNKSGSTIFHSASTDFRQVTPATPSTGLGTSTLRATAAYLLRASTDNLKTEPETPNIRPLPMQMNSIFAPCQEQRTMTPRTGTPRCLFRHRISPISIESNSTDLSLYSHYISNWPSNWEINGIKLLSEEFVKYPCRIHIANMSNPSALSELHKLRCKYKSLITCETCPHYLIFSDRHIVDGDTRFKCAPPIRSEDTRALLWDLVNMTMVDSISSAHNPVPPPLKFAGDFSKAVSGITGLGFSLQSTWTVVKERVPASQWDHYIVKLARWMATANADMLGLKDRGRIVVGAVADFLVWQPEVKSEQNTSYSRYPSMCPYTNIALFGHIHAVFLRGELAYSDGSFFARGQLLWANHLMKV